MVLILWLPLNADKIGPKVDAINTYIEDELVSIKEEIDSLPSSRKKGYDELNQLFLRYVW